MNRYKVKRKLNLDKSLVCCITCGKECKGERSLKSHITQTHTERLHKKRGPKVGNTPWNKGLSKETDDRVLDNSIKSTETNKALYASGDRNKGIMSAEARAKLSKRMSENNPGGRCKWYEVNGVKVQGTWERDIAVKLTEMNITWERPKSLQYVNNEGKKRYTPDFYLPQYDIYLEVKGYWWGDDKHKMELVMSQHSCKRFVIIEQAEYNKILDGELVW